MRKLTFLLIMCICGMAYGQPRSGSPSPKWIDLGNEYQGRPRTIVVSGDVISQDPLGSHIISLDIVGRESLDAIAVRRDEWLQNGFPTPDDVTLTWDDSTHTLTVSATGVSYDYYIQGIKYNQIANLTKQIDNESGNWVIYFDSEATLVSVKNPSHDQIDSVIENDAIVAYVYWNATLADGRLMYELHKSGMTPATHHWIHDNIGSVYKEGMALSGFDADGNGDTDPPSQFTTASGEFYDEDIEIKQEAVADGGTIEVWYLVGSVWTWNLTTDTWQAATAYSLGDRIVEDNSYFEITTAGTSGGGEPVWAGDREPGDTVVDNTATWTCVGSPRSPVMNYVGGNYRLAWNDGGTQTEMTNNDFVLCHIFATNMTPDVADREDCKYIAIQGQARYTTLNQARNGAEVEINNLTYGTLPVQEIIPVASIIFQTSNGYDNQVKGRVRSTDAGDDYIDWRSSSLKATGGSISSHSSLANLSSDDHAQYPLLLGRTGGQTLYGSDTTAEGLTLYDNSVDLNKVTLDSNGLTFHEPNGDTIIIDHTGTVGNITNSSGNLNIVTASEMRFDSSSTFRFRENGGTAWGLKASSSYDQMVFFYLSAQGNQLVHTLDANKGKDHDHATLSRPVVYFQSLTNPDTNNTEYGQLSHTGTGSGNGSFEILSGTGEISFGDDNITTTGTGTFGSTIVINGSTNPGTITESNGTLSFADDNLLTTGNITANGDNSQIVLGNQSGATGKMTIEAFNSNAFQVTDGPAGPNTIFNVDTDLGVITWVDGGSVNANTAYTHSQVTGDGGIHGTNYLKDNASDSTSGRLTAAGLTSSQVINADLTTTAIASDGDISLTGSGDTIIFSNDTGDKINLYSNSYGIGVESNTLTNWSGTNHRWRIGGTSVSTGTAEMVLNATELTPGANAGNSLGTDALEWNNLWIDGTGYFDALVMHGTATMRNINAVADDTYDIGTTTVKYQDIYLDGVAYTDKLQVEGTTATTYNRIGVGTTNHGLSDTDQLMIQSHFEVDGTTYLDGGADMGAMPVYDTGDILPTSDNSSKLGTSSLAWHHIYSEEYYATGNAQGIGASLEREDFGGVWSMTFVDGLLTAYESECFIAGTKVQMEEGIKNIEDVEIGEKVLSYDGKKQVISEVLDIYDRKANHYYILEFDDHTLLNVTGKHPIMTPQGWASIQEGNESVETIPLDVGDYVVTKDGTKQLIGWLKIEGLIRVYNLGEVEDTHCYYADGFLVHNKCVDGDTLVMTTKGEKKIKDIVPGDSVYGLFKGQVVATEVLHKYEKKMLGGTECKTLASGITASTNHEFVSENVSDMTGTKKTLDVVYDLATGLGNYYIGDTLSKGEKI